MYNNIGIIGAMEEEIALLLEDMTQVNKEEKAGIIFYSGKYQDKNIVMVISGIGKVNAAVCTQILIGDYKVEAVINTGVAGSLCNDIDIADIVVSTDTLNHDMDTTLFGDEYGQVPRMKEWKFKADEKLVDLAMECGKDNLDVKLFKGRVLTGDQFIADKKKKQWLIDTFNGLCCEMEGCAVGQTAYLNNIPFVIVRAISDKSDGSDAVEYYAFKMIAIQELHKLIIKMIDKM